MSDKEQCLGAVSMCRPWRMMSVFLDKDIR